MPAFCSMKQHVQVTSVSGLPQTLCPQVGQVNLVFALVPPF